MKICCTILAASFSLAAPAAWYWPFGGDRDENEAPRISDLMEPATLLIDEASDLADEGKGAEAVKKYDLALQELERIELENPERAATSEFSTVRNKKAYVQSAIDSLLLDEARKNAKAVAVTDTTALEDRLAKEKEDKAASAAIAASAPVAERTGAIRKVLSSDPKNRRARLMMATEDLKKKDYGAAKLAVKELLAEKPNDAPALNLLAAIEASEGDLASAKRTLERSIRSNPKSHHAYYNLARLVLQMRGEEQGKETARRYYENGRRYCNGPEDRALEELLK